MELNDRYLTAKEKLSSQHKTSRPKIQKVRRTLLYDEEQLKLYCNPRLASFGPIHRPAVGESQKYKWAATYMAKRNGGGDEAQLCQKIANNITRLKELYTEDAIEGYSDNELVWMFFVDGCAMLYLLNSFRVSDLTDQMAELAGHESLIIQDLVLLENQLPYELLKLLTDDYEQLKESMDSVVLSLNPLELLKERKTVSIENLQQDDPIHFLDHFRKCMLARLGLQNNGSKSGRCMGVLRNCCDNLKNKRSSDQDFDPEAVWALTRNIQSLKEAGIFQVKRDDNATLSNISFHSHFFVGYLHLPPVYLSEWVVVLLRNLKAYELCPDFKNEFELCPFISLLRTLINCKEDVKDLRSAHVLLSTPGSDTKVVELFRNLARDPFALNIRLHSSVQPMMNKYFKNRCRTWVGEAL